MELSETAGPPPAARSDGRLAGWLVLVLALAALNYWSRYGLETEGVVADEPLYEWSTFFGALIQFTLMLAIVLAIVRPAPNELLALRRPDNWGAAIGIMAGILVATFLVAGIVSAVGLDPGEEQGLTPDEWRPERLAPFAANFAVAALYVPLVEELVFRGAGVTLLARFGAWTAILVTGVLFGLGHGLLEALPILVLFGVGLAYLRVHTGSVVPCVVLHAVFNAFSLIVSVAAGGGGT